MASAGGCGKQGMSAWRIRAGAAVGGCLQRALWLGWLLMAPLLANAQSRALQLQAQPLARSLTELARALDLQILVPPELTQGRQAPALQGQYTPAQALQRLLAGTGLSYRQGDTGVITIIALPATAPRVAGTAAMAPATATLPALLTSLAPVQVTGSHIPRSVLQAAAPVTVISAQQIEREGHRSLAEALATHGVSDYGAESEGAGGRFSANAQPLNLKGLGPGRALILVDGRRLPDYPFPSAGRSNFQSLGSIPLASVERVEVMTGGASAIYGADAIAGVVNIVLKRGRTGAQLRLRTGSSSQGGGNQLDVQWAYGHGGEDWGVDYALQYTRSGMLRGSQRDMHRPAQVAAQPALALAIGQRPDPASIPLAPFLADACAPWQGQFTQWNYRPVPGALPLQGDSCGSWDGPGYASLSDGVQALSGQLHGQWQLSAATGLWLSAQYWRSRSRLSDGMEVITGPHLPATGKVDQFQDPRYGVIAPWRVLTPQEVGGLAALDDRYREWMLDLATGLRGQYGTHWNWNFSLSHTDYVAQRARRRLLGDKVNAFFFGPSLGTTSTGMPIRQLDLAHWLQPITPEDYAALSSVVDYNAQTHTDALSYRVNGRVMALPAGALEAALIMEASRQRYRLRSTPSVLPLQLDLYDLTGSVGDGVRDRLALGGEVRVPLTSALTASLAGRLDDYRDGTGLPVARTWNAGLEWRPQAGVLLRTSHATSFKAPDMHWIFTDGGGSFGTAVDATACINAGANPRCEGYSHEFLTRTYRNPALQAETGRSTTAGVVWDASPALTLSLDYWDVRNQGGIGRVSPAQLLRDEAECMTGLTLDGRPGTVDPQSMECRKARMRVTRSGANGGGQVLMVESMPVNQSWRHLRGVDAALDWRETTGLGDFSANLLWSHTFWAQRRMRAPGTLHDVWRDASDNLAFRSNLRGSVGWQGQGRWSGNLFGVRYGSLPRADGSGRLPAQLLWNANLARRISERTLLTLFVNNLLDVAPPRDSSNTVYPYYYDEVYSAVGREFALQLDYNFD